MSGQNTKGSQGHSDSDGNLRSADALDRYNSERTKQILGKMLSEYADDDSKNYFQTPHKDDTLFDAEEYMQEVKKQADEFERLKNKNDGGSSGIKKSSKGGNSQTEGTGFSLGGIFSKVRSFISEPDSTEGYDDYDNSNDELDKILGDESDRNAGANRLHGFVLPKKSTAPDASERKKASAGDGKPAKKTSGGLKFSDDDAKKTAEDIIYRIVGLGDDEVDISEPDYIADAESAAEKDESPVQEDPAYSRATMIYKDSVEKIKAALEKDNRDLAEKKSVIEEEKALRRKAEQEEMARLDEQWRKRDEEKAEERNKEREKMLAEEKSREEADRIAREEAAERVKAAEEEKRKAEEEEKIKAEEEQKRLEAEARKKQEDEQRREENRRKIEQEKQRVLDEENRKKIEAERIRQEEEKRISSSKKRKKKKGGKKQAENMPVQDIGATADAVQQTDTAESANADTNEKEGEDDMKSRDSKTMTDDIIAAATRDSGENDVQTYEPRRAGTRRKARKNAKKLDNQAYDDEYYDDYDDGADDDDSSILPEVEKAAVRMDKNDMDDGSINDIMSDDYDDDAVTADEQNVKVIRIPLKGVMLTLLIIVLVAAVTGMAYLCKNYRQRLDDANDTISSLKSSDKTAKYEKQIEDMQVKIDDLTAQLKIAGGTQTTQAATAANAESTTQATTTQTTTKSADNEKTDADTGLVKDGIYIVQDGDSLYSIAQKVYGDSTRYSDIMDANNMTEDNNGLQIGDELVIP